MPQRHYRQPRDSDRNRHGHDVAGDLDAYAAGDAYANARDRDANAEHLGADGIGEHHDAHALAGDRYAHALADDRSAYAIAQCQLVIRGPVAQLH
jgi:hypothetical protein